MKYQELIDALSQLPKDKLLYNSLNHPTWFVGDNGVVVLAGSPCPIQTVEHQLYRLKQAQMRDLPSKDYAFTRSILEDTPIYTIQVSTNNRGLKHLKIVPITQDTINLWQISATDNLLVDVAIGGPMYIQSSDKVKIMVNKPYYNFLGEAGKRNYLNELLNVHGYSWVDDRGQMQFMNKHYWNGEQCHCVPTTNQVKNIGGFNEVNNTDTPTIKTSIYTGCQND